MDRIDLSLLWTLLPPVMIVASIGFGWRAVKLLGRLWQKRDGQESPFWLVRGGRALIVAIACACIAAGMTYDVRGLMWFGVAFLGEELYETGMVLLILRHHRKKMALAVARSR
jgi:hypothetical protein